MLRTELPSSAHGVDLAHHGPLRHRSAPGLAGIVGLRACIPGQHDVQRALIQRPPYGHKRSGRFQTID
ncbi:hypothetical protein [Stenotrophomonas sp. AR026]|uniref:hypothetical protein n=1 Tax=Stenotrophomonas sp. AR026 TaxID=3398462 RepID=UPI003BB10DB8